MPDSAGSKKAAAFSRGTHVERKEFRRRIRLMFRKELSFSLTYTVYHIFGLVQIFVGFFLPAAECRILPAAKHRQNAKAPLPAKTAGLQNKERNEHDGESVLCIEEILLSSSLVYIIPDFPAGANFCRIFSLTSAGSRHSAAVSRRIFDSWPSDSGIPPAAFRTISSLYRREKPSACHCISFRLDRPTLSRPPYLLYRENLRLPFANNLSSQAPSAPATTFQELQTNKQKNPQKNPQKSSKDL